MEGWIIAVIIIICIIIVILIVITIIVVVKLFQDKKNLPDPIESVDLNKYKGKWYEIAKLPFVFEKDCKNVTANYDLTSDGKIKVVNSCQNIYSNKIKESKGIGKPSKDVQIIKSAILSPAKLDVTFFWPFTGKYWIFDLDKENYKYSLVGTPNKKNLWILSRDKYISPEIYKNLVEKAKTLGFPVENLIKTIQQ